MKTQLFVIIAAVVCGLSFCTLPAYGYLITIQIEAVVDSVEDEDNYLEGQISPGDIITGYYIYESTTPDSQPSYPTVGRYEHYDSPCGIFLSVGGFEFKTNPTNVDFLVGIANDVTSGGLHDSYWIHSYNNLPLSNGTLVDSISWSLRDYSATALSGIGLPITAPVLDDWPSNQLRMRGPCEMDFVVDAHVTSAIPEPATVLLLGLGGLLIRKRN